LDWVIVSTWVSTGVIVSSLVYTVKRNNNTDTENQAKFRTEIKSDMKTVKQQLADPETGLNAIKKSVR
jgi:hypothetical protein